ncbi:hypothetical protein BC936DRAFT_138546 [Jimgerdemannia flammicorona]|uniref:Uncharacterized protein n=1 Tax=Jimgerdemannia flammicorona TaxID=994334 RepID=A0A433C6B3_9FUNG|nr:hypothetical protein BC936DRAFT_138546 [Jimgerdemannia flammicorona]
MTYEISFLLAPFPHLLLPFAPTGIQSVRPIQNYQHSLYLQLNRLYASRVSKLPAFTLAASGHHIDDKMTKNELIDDEGIFAMFWKTMPQGATTQVWVISALKDKSDAYLENVSVSSPRTEQAGDPKVAGEPKVAERLRSVSE